MKVSVKKDIRRDLIHRRESLREEERKRLSEGVVRNLLTLAPLREAGILLAFYPHRGEPDITPLFSWAVERGKSLLLPRVEGDELRIVRVREGMDLSPGAYRIPEPSEGEEVSPELVDVSLVPGVAFDREGYRIGYGKGYYDRLLGRLGGLKVGVCYEFQLLGVVPRDSWDVPVDLVVTEEKIYQGGKTR